jgi:hypothetical protein
MKLKLARQFHLIFAHVLLAFCLFSRLLDVSVSKEDLCFLERPLLLAMIDWSIERSGQFTWISHAKRRRMFEYSRSSLQVYKLMSLPFHKRYEIVFLTNHKYGPRFGAQKIAKIVSCNRKTVTRCLERRKKTKDLSDRPRSGAPCATNAEQDQKIVDMDTTSETIQLVLKSASKI